MTGRERIEELMDQLAGGDTCSLWQLHAEFSGPIGAAVRREARRMRIWWLREPELRSLELDVCTELARAARAWRPSGALPWVWARRRIAGLVREAAGQHHFSFDPATVDLEEAETTVAPPDEDPLLTLARLATHDSRCALLLAALHATGRERDARVMLRLAQQHAQGDPCPSRTVGREQAMSPEAVRKAASRGRRRLRDIAAADERFADLMCTALVA